ncbi:MAG TPA: DNA mismatch repair protein MutS [Bacteroidetes bacterium]|nr:DNA mismatch repair protein MutS [Bacteroidota bacterium]
MATPMMEQYHRIKQRYPEEVIFFRMGDFFEMFHEDAVMAHEILGITLTKRSHGKGEASVVPLAGFPHHQLEAYLAKMTRAGKRVVVVDQVEDPKKAKGLVKRDIVRIVTAGTNLSEEALESGRNQYLAAVLFHGEEAGLAVCDVTTGEFAVASLPAGEIADRLDLIRPAEILLPEDQRDRLAAAGTGGAMMTRLPPWVFEQQFARDTLIAHFQVQTLKGFGIEEDEIALRAAGAAVHYVRENLCGKADHIRGISRLPTEKYLLLDAPTRRNLELVEPLWGGDRRGTLLYHLDRTVTPFGRRLFLQRLLRPSLEIPEIERRLDAVEELIGKAELRAGLRERLRSLSDLERLTARLAAGRGTPRDAGGLRDTLARIPAFAGMLEEAASDRLAAIAASLDPLEELVGHLREALVEEPPATLLHGGAIREGYDPTLDELRSVARGGKEYILTRQEEERASTGISSLTIGYNKVFGYYIEVTKPNLDKVPEEYIRKQTLVNAERYITPELKEWEEKILNAEEQSLEIERNLFEELRRRVTEEASRIQANARLLAELDVYASAAELAVQQGYHRPVVAEEGPLRLVRSRHPVVENLLPPGESFVPNDLEMEGDRQIALVTGPNMGGKSTYLRQVGLIVLMAQVGLFVPAEEARIPVTDRIFTRVGASDNLAAGESTFLVEMHEAANILHNATGRSLVLLDEIGRGTSTFDGLSLAWAMVEYLHDFPGGARPKTLFATHYHELTTLEESLPRVFNLHVEVKEWGDRIIFLRKVKPGASGASYGIQVARLAGVPQQVIERAGEVLGTLEASEFTEEHVPRLAKASGVRRLPPPVHDPFQLTLFTVEERALRDEIAGTDVNNMTPLEALRFLADLQKRYPPPPEVGSEEGAGVTEEDE